LAVAFLKSAIATVLLFASTPIEAALLQWLYGNTQLNGEVIHTIIPDFSR
jgi:hypothetical protein